MNAADRLHRLAVIQSLRREAELNGDSGRWFNEGIKAICYEASLPSNEESFQFFVDPSNGSQFEKGQKYAIQRLTGVEL